MSGRKHCANDKMWLRSNYYVMSQDTLTVLERFHVYLLLLESNMDYPPTLYILREFHVNTCTS